MNNQSLNLLTLDSTNKHILENLPCLYYLVNIETLTIDETNDKNLSNSNDYLTLYPLEKTIYNTPLNFIKNNKRNYSSPNLKPNTIINASPIFNNNKLTHIVEYHFPSNEVVANGHNVSVSNALNESQFNIQEILKKINFGVAIYKSINNGEDFEYIEFNDMAEKMTAFHKSDLIGKTVSSARKDILKSGLVDVLKKVFQTGQPQYFSAEINPSGNENRYFHNYVYKLSTNEVVAIFEDYTQDTVNKKNADFIHNSALELVEMPVDNDLYNYLTEKLFQLTKADIILVSKYDTETNMFQIERLKSRDNSTKFVRMLNKNPEGLKFNLAEPRINNLRKGEIIKYDEDFETFMFGLYPNEVAQRIKNNFHVHSVYSIGFSWNKRLFGHTSLIFCNDNEIENQDLIKTFIKQISVSLQNRKNYFNLLESEEQFRGLIDLSPLAIIRFNLNGNIQGWNKAFNTLTEFSDDKIEGRHFSKLKIIHEKDIPKLTAIIPEIVESQAPQEFNFRWIHSDKTVRYGLAYLSVIKKNSKVSGIQAIIRDISDEKKAENALRKSEKKFRAFIESAPIGITLISDRGKFEYVNPSFLNLIETTEESILSTSFINLIAPESLKKALKGFQDLDIFQKASVSEIIINTPLHNKLYTSIDAVKLNNTQYLAFWKDITEIKKYQSDLIRAKEKAEESDMLKTYFLSNMSHEIRTPLNGIIGFTELLMRKTMSETDLKKYVNIIHNSSQQLLTIISDIVDVSKIESNQLTFYYRDFNIHSFADDILHFFNYYEPKIISEQIRLISSIDVEEHNGNIYGDPDRIRQVLNNLIKNAIKFTESGYVKFGAFFKEPGWLMFYVQDTGIGISKSNFEIIFERFRQIDGSSTRQYGGTGLGLTISDGLVKAMGGLMWVESIESIGTTFYFSMPIQQGVGFTKTPTPNHKGKEILLYDIDCFSTHVMADFIRNTKAELTIINEPENLEYQYDLIIFNPEVCLVSEIEGVFKLIRKNNPQTPVLICSRYNQYSKNEFVSKYKCVDMLNRNLSPKDFYLKVNPLLKD